MAHPKSQQTPMMPPQTQTHEMFLVPRWRDLLPLQTAVLVDMGHGGSRTDLPGKYHLA